MPSHMGVHHARAIDVDRDLVWSEFLRDRLAQAAYAEFEAEYAPCHFPPRCAATEAADEPTASPWVIIWRAADW